MATQEVILAKIIFMKDAFRKMFQKSANPEEVVKIF